MTTRQLLKQSGIKTSEKVVCIDDAYQRVDLANTPDGLLSRGRVYCVSGVSACGGVLLAGLRAISVRTGTEVGFHPSRFCTLEQFWSEFPKGISSIPTGDDDLGFLTEDTAKPGKRIEFPEIEGLEEPKPLVYRVIEVLEALHAEHHQQERTPLWLQSGHWPDQSPERVQLELRALLRSPHLSAYLNQMWMFWRFLMRSQKPTVLFCRSHTPVANMLFLMCMRGSTFSEQLLEGDVKERDFPVLTCGAGRLSNAPIRICDARSSDAFMRVLFDAQALFDYALCDWMLKGEEMAAAYRMTRDSQIMFLCPQ
jgi:hypothetical protein